MSIADRTLDPPGDFGSEHTDALCTRDMGWLMGWAATPQEVFDKTLIAYAHRRGPAGAAAADGGAGRVLRLAHRGRGGDAGRRAGGRLPAALPAAVPARPAPAGLARPADPPRRRARRCSWSGPGRWRTRSRSSGRRPTSSPSRSAATTRISSRSTCSTTPTMAIVISGGHAVTCRAAIRLLRERGVKIGMARLLWIRPFPSEDLRAALRGVKAVGVVETNLGLGGVDLRRHPRAGRDRRPVPRGEPAAGHLVHGRARRRDRARWPSSSGWPASSPRPWQRGRVEKAAHWVGFEELTRIRPARPGSHPHRNQEPADGQGSDPPVPAAAGGGRPRRRDRRRRGPRPPLPARPARRGPLPGRAPHLRRAAGPAIEYRWVLKAAGQDTRRWPARPAACTWPTRPTCAPRTPCPGRTRRSPAAARSRRAWRPAYEAHDPQGQVTRARTRTSS